LEGRLGSSSKADVAALVRLAESFLGTTSGS
jgi:hypothetical protein